MWLTSVLSWLVGAPSAPFLCLLGCPMILKPSIVCNTRSPRFILELSFFILVICESVTPFHGEYFKIKQSLSVRCTHCCWGVLVLTSFQWSELGRTHTCAVPDSWGCRASYHKLGGLKQQKGILSQFWMQNVQNQGAGRAVLPLRLVGALSWFLLPLV